jgi:peptidoglycan/LPS O-acetylase OafA/YrhL
MNLQKEEINSTISHKLHGLDHLRTVAIAFVFIFHYGYIFASPAWVRTIGKFGWTGVDLFFVLSGYLIASQLFEKIARSNSFSIKSFFIKRFFRIIPAYLFIVALYYFFPFVRERSSLAPIWKYLTFTQNFGLDLRTQGTFSHAWSLCVEEQFYFLFPFILTALLFFKIFRKSFWLLPILFISGIVLRFYLYQHFSQPTPEWHKLIYYPTYCRLDGLLAGISIAALFQFKPIWKEKITRYGNILFIVSLAILSIAYFICEDEQSFIASVYGFPLVSLGYAFMVTSAISPTSFLYKFNSRITATIATLSYAIYLVHKITLHISQEEISKSGIEKNSNIMFVICIIASIVCAYLMNILIEKPFLRVRKKLLKSE